MRSIVPTLATAALALAVGCADSTSPSTASSRGPGSPSALLGNPPPPPVDTGSYASTQQGAFAVQAIYFVNPTYKSGFIHFNTTQPAGVVISPNASIDYHLGTITGTGTITAPVSGGTITLDLSKTTDGTFQTACDKNCAQVPVSGTFIDSETNTSTPTTGYLTVGVRSQTTNGG